jgi:hypothetical protein
MTFYWEDYWKVSEACADLAFIIYKSEKKTLTPKIPSPFLPISTSKMLKISKKSPNFIFLIKNAEISTP